MKVLGDVILFSSKLRNYLTRIIYDHKGTMVTRSIEIMSQEN
ncbi:MAG: hypothetical protein ACE5HI_08240 [bacterium]